MTKSERKDLDKALNGLERKELLNETLCNMFGIKPESCHAVFPNDNKDGLVFATVGCYHLEVKTII